MSSALSIVQKRFPKVTKVIDSKNSVRVEVTSRDASSKAVKNHEECAMAQACKRSLKVDGAIIARNKAYLIKGTKAFRFDVPPSLSREVVSFDRGAAFETGTYQLSKATSRIRPLKTNPRDRGRKRHGKGHVIHRTTGIRAALGAKEAA